MRIGMWASLMLLPAVGLYAGAADDDLSVVKRAVAERERPEPVAKSQAQAAPVAHSQTARGGKPAQWLRVRIVDKKDKKTTVSINLPLGLVRAFSDDLKLDDEWRGRDGKRLTLTDVLSALDAGQNLVEVDGGDASVRVWVE